MNCELEDKIFNIQQGQIDELAIEVFRFQYANNLLYKSFIDALTIDPQTVSSVASIPFLPVSFFKTHEVKSTSFTPEVVFESSGTTQSGNSRHLLKSLSMYRKSFTKAFRNFYGEPEGWCIIGLLPSYLERRHSSLVLMVDELIKLSRHEASGFYLYNHEELARVISSNERANQKTLLIGVTFALLDFAEAFSMPLKHTIVMETGGMKGRRKEITREEVHQLLKSRWALKSVHSEYGMTELLSQAYSRQDGIFISPPWMKVLVRDEDDPLTVKTSQQNRIVTGLVNVIDLANLYSCSFVAVDDICKLHPDGSFEILGRMDSSDVRGCSLMVG